MNFLTKIFKKIISFIKSLDYFGYTIKMHFGTYLDKEEEGDYTHKTFFGGFVSLGINSIMIYFVYLFCK